MFLPSLANVIKDEKIGYNQSVIVNSKQLTEVFYYSREFDTYTNYKICNVQINIPYTGIRGYSCSKNTFIFR